jgi:prolipoprotein diacylglyceryltransferase
MSLGYLIWNGSPEIFSLGSLSLRWYGLLFALGFLISQQILYYMFRTEGKPEKDVDTLTIYMVVATVLGARLGHVIFYQPEMFLDDPLGVLLPFEFSPEFKFTGLQGLASHGGAFGILFALWLYARKKKPGQNYFQVLDRIVILVALTGCLIRLGNFFNSEIIGKPTDGPLGVVFINRVEDAFTRGESSPVESVKVFKNEDAPDGPNGRKPIKIFVFFKPDVTKEVADIFVQQDAHFYLGRLDEFVDESPTSVPNYQLIQLTEGGWAAGIFTMGIARHPAQLYESISCLLLFAFLFWLWTRKKAETQTGLIFGWFMVILWTLRFSYEFLKENQVSFEDQMTLNMGQILSIPLILAGFLILYLSYQNKLTTSSRS